MSFFVAMEHKIALNPFGGDFGGKRGSGKNHFSARGFRGLARLASFYSISVPRVQFFPVFAMFAMTTMAHSVTLTPASQVTSIKAG